MYYLHPEYDNKELTEENIRDINALLFNSLSATDCKEWDLCQRNCALFSQIREKSGNKGDITSVKL